MLGLTPLGLRDTPYAKDADRDQPHLREEKIFLKMGLILLN